MKKKVDILAKISKDPLKEIADQQAVRNCMHTQMRLERYGAVVRCIDCKRRWFVCMNDQFDLPDYTYGNPKIGVSETRHSPNEPQRNAPRK